MIAAFICVLSVVALFRFMVSYCHSVLESAGKTQLSEQFREVSGIGQQTIQAGDFSRLLQLIHLCPENGSSPMEIRVVGFYYDAMYFLQQLSGALVPAVATWAERERMGCSYFAAVELDHRMSHTRALFAQQGSNLS